MKFAIILLIIAIFLIYRNSKLESMSGDICFGNCGCETEQLCGHRKPKCGNTQYCAIGGDDNGCVGGPPPVTYGCNDQPIFKCGNVIVPAPRPNKVIINNEYINVDIQPIIRSDHNQSGISEFDKSQAIKAQDDSDQDKKLNTLLGGEVHLDDKALKADKKQRELNSDLKKKDDMKREGMCGQGKQLCGYKMGKMCDSLQKLDYAPQYMDTPCLKYYEGCPQQCNLAYPRTCAGFDYTPHLEDSYGSRISGCYDCEFNDFTCSGEPKCAQQPVPPIATEVLTIGGVKPTALTYERRDPPRGDIAVSGLNLIDNSHTKNPLMIMRELPPESNIRNKGIYDTITEIPNKLAETFFGSRFGSSSASFTDVPERPLIYVDNNKDRLINYTYGGQIRSYFTAAPIGAKGRENSKTVVVLYKTNWCGFCTKMKPIFDKVANDCKGKNIDFSVVDCDEIPHPEIRSYPTIVLTDEMGKSFRYNRAADYQQLLSFVLSPVH